ncbi:MAG: hypothetical protein OEZ02_08680 [Anaerolineae bacterium]|nr:hypothetical protein [Anaerolineae bacterium]
MLDDFDIDIPEGPPPEESNNRTFLMAAGGIGVVAIIFLLCLAGIWFINRGGTPADQDPTAAAINAQNTEAALAAAQTATAASFSPTPSPTATATLLATATATPDGGDASVTPGGPTADPRTLTVEALLTQAALVQTQNASAYLTVTATATALPNSGFADDVGLPGLFALTALLLLVIFFSRRLREAGI